MRSGGGDRVSREEVRRTRSLTTYYNDVVPLFDLIMVVALRVSKCLLTSLKAWRSISVCVRFGTLILDVPQQRSFPTPNAKMAIEYTSQHGDSRM